MDYFGEMVALLKNMAMDHELSARVRMHCIRSGLILMRSEGEVVEVDPAGFYNALYDITMRDLVLSMVLSDSEIAMDIDGDHVDISMDIVNFDVPASTSKPLAYHEVSALVLWSEWFDTLALIFTPGRHVANNVLSAYIHRMLQASCILPAHISGAVLYLVGSWVLRFVGVHESASELSSMLFDTPEERGQGAGITYDAQLGSADFAAADTCLAFECNMLRNHYHPWVKAMADAIMTKTQLPGLVGAVWTDAKRRATSGEIVRALESYRQAIKDSFLLKQSTDKFLNALVNKLNGHVFTGLVNDHDALLRGWFDTAALGSGPGGAVVVATHPLGAKVKKLSNNDGDIPDDKMQMLVLKPSNTAIHLSQPDVWKSMCDRLL